MKTTTTKKEARTVEVKLLVPYAIIVIMAVALTGIVTGWTLRSDFYSDVKAQVASQVAETAKVSTPKE